MKPGQRPNLVTVLIDDLMTPPVAQRVAEACQEMEANGSLDGFDLDDLSGIHSVPRLFGSTADPFRGVGGAAMTWFQLTVVYSNKVMLLSPNDRLYGVAPFDSELVQRVDPDYFTARRCQRRAGKLRSCSCLHFLDAPAHSVKPLEGSEEPDVIGQLFGKDPPVKLIEDWVVTMKMVQDGHQVPRETFSEHLYAPLQLS